MGHCCVYNKLTNTNKKKNKKIEDNFQYIFLNFK